MKMELRVCPECKKAFYTAAVEYPPPCPRCGHVLLDRRTQERKATTTNFTFLVEGKKRSATLLDFSKEGARIIYGGKTFPVNSVMDLSIDKLNIHGTAKAVWTKKIDSKSTTGLKFINA
jgi:predicted RNA-binding Zn-ribbon protein involved in translation (DUF1610 family)